MRLSTVLLSSILLLLTATTGQTMPEAGNVDQQNAAPQIQYVSFLEILPEALTLDQSLEIASLGSDAAKETAVASWSAWYPKADITLNQAEQYDVKPAGTNAGATSPGMTGANGSGSSNQRYNPTEAKLKITQKLFQLFAPFVTLSRNAILSHHHISQRIAR